MDNKREFFTGIYYHTSLGFNKLLRGVEVRQSLIAHAASSKLSVIAEAMRARLHQPEFLVQFLL